MSLRALIQRPMPVTAPLVLNPLMAKLVEAAGFSAGYLGGGATGYQKVSLEANLNVTEMCQAAIDIGAVASLPLILDGACGARLGARGEGHARCHRDRETARHRAGDRREGPGLKAGRRGAPPDRAHQAGTGQPSHSHTPRPITPSRSLPLSHGSSSVNRSMHSR